MEGGQLEDILVVNKVEELVSELDKIIQPYLLEVLPRKPRSLEL
jgi:hypothetical protein